MRAYRGALIFLATGAAFTFVSVRVIRGLSPFNFVGSWTRASLVDADVSVKPPNWTSKNNPELLDLVKGVDLAAADLRYADAIRAFLAEANLWGAHLEHAYLFEADLRGANLSECYLNHATLSDADLSRADLSLAHLPGADLHNSDLTSANLIGADLAGANLAGSNLDRARLAAADLRFANFGPFGPSGGILPAKGLTVAALKTAKNWDKAYYDDNLLKQLGLPPDHNEKLREEQTRAGY